MYTTILKVFFFFFSSHYSRIQCLKILLNVSVVLLNIFEESNIIFNIMLVLVTSELMLMTIM